MWAARVDEGLVFGDLTPASLETLKGVPMLIESGDVRVRERLLPETCLGEDDEQDWRQHAVPELERLFLSRAQLVRRDLANLRQIPKTTESVLFIQDGHVHAWLAALNAARLALFALADLKAEHMEEDGFLAADSKQQEAVLRIQLMAWMQSVLLGDEELESTGRFEDFVLE
jgi:hypothetical protein